MTDKTGIIPEIIQQASGNVKKGAKEWVGEIISQTTGNEAAFKKKTQQMATQTAEDNTQGLQVLRQRLHHIQTASSQPNTEVAQEQEKPSVTQLSPAESFNNRKIKQHGSSKKFESGRKRG